MYIINPFRKRGMAASDLTSTHPPISERIRILRAMAGASYLEYDQAYQQVRGAGRRVISTSAVALAKAGAKVIVNDVIAERVPIVVNKIRQAGGNAEGCVASVANTEGAHRIMQTAIDKFGRIDILVNNAGIMGHGALVDLTEEDYDKVIAVNLKGEFLCAKEAVPHMIKQKWGSIINMSSGAVRGGRQSTAYSSSKAGVVGLSLSWAIELAEYGITCNAIRGSAHTRMTEGGAERARQAILAGGVPPRSVTDYLLPPEALSPLVVFLASDQAYWINGQFIGIDGPWLAIWSQTRPVSTAIMPSGWTVEHLLEHFRTTVGMQLEHYGWLRVTGGREPKALS